MNPYESPTPEASRDATRDEPGCVAQIAIHSVLWIANIAFFVFVCVLYWLGGTTAIIAVFVGIPVALLITLLLLYWWFVPTPTQRRDYLRAKRRKMRGGKEDDG